VKFDRSASVAVGTPANSGVSFGLGGTRWDPVTGLYQTEADPYDPATGTRLHQDNLAFASGTTNFYAWCGNDPMDWNGPWVSSTGSMGFGLQRRPRSSGKR
jgi:RHS repeat-associated protein